MPLTDKERHELEGYRFALSQREDVEQRREALQEKIEALDREDATISAGFSSGWLRRMDRLEEMEQETPEEFEKSGEGVNA